MGLTWGFEAAIYDDAYYNALNQNDYKIQDVMLDPISFMSDAKGDTMYSHKAMGAPDKPKFQKLLIKEFRNHCNRCHF